jgi:uncharacterized membrane protein (DUF485 family)
MDASLRAIARARWRVVIALTAFMVVVYFGFILLIAFNKPLMGRLIVPGLSVGILTGALVIVVSWLVTLWYVRWANLRYDPVVDRLKREGRS